MQEKKEGTLYIVSTPIGNLEDMTHRAIRILGEVEVVAAEDTRRTLQLLNHFGIKNRLVSMHEHSNEGRIEEVVTLLKDGCDVALCSDAGTPVISDPGAPLIRRAAEEGLEIVAVPGACAAIAALCVSAISAEQFLFWGFLPKKKKERGEALKRVFMSPYTNVLYESPHQLVATLEMMEGLCAHKKIALCKELTKLHEQVFRGSVSEVLEQLAMQPIRGEYVIVVEGLVEEQVETTAEEAEIQRCMDIFLDNGLSRKNTAAAVAQLLQISKNTVYALLPKDNG